MEQQLDGDVLSKDFYIFNERNKNMFLCMVAILKKGEELLIQKRGGELLEKYPHGIKMGMGSSA